MLPNLNRPAIKSGSLTLAELNAARMHSTGEIWQRPHRLLPAGCDQQGRYITRTLPDDCAEEGGEHHEPAPTQQSRPGVGIALVLAPWLAGVIGWAVMARLG